MSRSFVKLSLSAAALLVALAGCKNPLALDKKSLDDDDTSSSTSSKKKDKSKDKDGAAKDGAAKDGATTPAKDEAPMWTEVVTGEKKKMARVDLAAGGLDGFSLLAPEGAKVTKSLGGQGAEIADSDYGYLVWVHEDPTATMDLMKQAATAWNKDAKFPKETKTSLVISEPSFDGQAAYYYKGLYKIGGKTYVCETPTSIAPTQQAHAEEIGRACDSLEGAGGKTADASADASAAPSAVADAAPADAHAGTASNAVASNGGSPSSADAANANNAALTQALGGSAGGGAHGSTSSTKSPGSKAPAPAPTPAPLRKPVPRHH